MPTTAPAAHLVELIYELLDAHDDTVRLADDVSDDEPWAAHVDYLRQLQRVGRELLASCEPATFAVPAAPVPGFASRHRPD
jgi:hypothetical protein